MDSHVQLGKLTRREFRHRMGSGELRAVILPIAAIEQHLEHMAMEHDWRSAQHIAIKVAERLAPQVLVAEPLQIGISEHHMSHPGTLTLQPGTMMMVVSDVVDSLIRAGFHNILVLNGHGGNIQPFANVWDQYLRKFQVNLQFLPYWDVLTAADAEVLETKSIPGHAQEFETAFGLAAFPENVRTDMWEDQDDKTPALATAENGQLLIDRTVERVSDFVQQMIDGEKVAEVPPFFP
jgi:creatinine amidohydrolase